jgi:hypothetical protein
LLLHDLGRHQIEIDQIVKSRGSGRADGPGKGIARLPENAAMAA